MKNRNILISGAGIAGPALAYWLHRHGFRATVVESGAGPRPGGHAVDLRGVAREVTELMGVLPEVRNAGVDERGFACVDATGRRLASMPADMFDGQGIVAEIEIMRGDLARILVDATRRDVEYVYGDSITGLEQGADGVRVTFRRGAPRVFDLVVGADGMHSAVRSLAFGPEERFVRDIGCYTALFQVPNVPTDGWMLMYNVPGGRLACVRPERDPSTSRAMFSFASPPLESRYPGYHRRDTARQKLILADVFAGVGWEVPRLLDALPQAGDFYFASMGRVLMDHWSAGRTVLLGDAGYCASPLTGLGTSLALVGAYVLAGELAAAEGDHQVAFGNYESALRPYVAQCQQLPPGGVRAFVPKTSAGIWLRAQSMRAMSVPPFRGILAKQFHKGDAITLRDYAVPAPSRP